MFSTDVGLSHPLAKATSTKGFNPDYLAQSLTTVLATDDAGGVPGIGATGNTQNGGKRCWYVVYVSPRAEKKVRDDLLNSGYEAYAATREEIHLWGRGQRKKVDKVIITGVVFVKIARTQRDDIRLFPNVYSYMMDPAKHNAPGQESFAIIRDEEMRLLKAMLGQEDYDVDFTQMFSVGEYVQIAGFDTYDDLAQIIRIPNDKSTYVGVRVGFLGCAYMKVPKAKIIKVRHHPTPTR